MASAMASEHGQYQPLRHMQGVDVKSVLRRSPRASSAAVAGALVPLGGALLALSGLVLLATVAGLAVAAPLLIVFSPVLVPAALAVGLAVAGFLASGALGLTGLTTLAWLARHFLRRGRGGGGATGLVLEPVEDAKRSTAEGAAFVGRRVRDAGQAVTQAEEKKLEKRER